MLENTQPPTESAHQHESTYPLTSFDSFFTHVGIVMGWLVEGSVDTHKLASALDKVTTRWPMLAGRLEDAGNGQFQIRVPPTPHPSPTTYERYKLTSSTSTRPISEYTPLPIPLVSDTLPKHLFKHPDAPGVAAEWIAKKQPILHWHITHFPGPESGSNGYSCIGLTFAHFMFDGVGIASVVHAVEAEMLGKPWPAPLLLEAGHNKNHLEATLDRAAEEKGGRKVFAEMDYHSKSVVTIWWLVTFVVWHLWLEKWHGSRARVYSFPPKALAKLVDDTRKAAAEKGDKEQFRLTRGDILAAFIFKTMYTDGTHPNTRVHLCSLASLRRFFNGELTNYPHNCVISLPYPITTVGQLGSTSLAHLSQQFAQTRYNFTEEEPLKARETFKRALETKKTPLLFKTDVDESVNFSNMCIANIVNIDWSGTGAGRTVCRYKTALVGHPVNVTNVLAVAGYLDDGTLVLDMNLTQRRSDRIESEIKRLVEESEAT